MCIPFVIDDKLKWNVNTDRIYCKMQQNLYFMRKLRNFDATPYSLVLFYNCFIQSIFMFSIQCWFGSLNLKNKSKITKLINIASKVSGVTLDSLQDVAERQILQLSEKIISDSTHILNFEFRLLPSGRRYENPKFRTNRASRSFIPVAVKLLNQT